METRIEDVVITRIFLLLQPEIIEISYTKTLIDKIVYLASISDLDYFAGLCTNLTFFIILVQDVPEIILIFFKKIFLDTS